MKNIIILILVLAVAYFGYTSFTENQSESNSNLTKLKNRETTHTIETRDINFSVTVAGEISPAEKVSVRPEVHGKIAELPVDISDQVAAGDLLFRLDDKDLKIEIDTRKKQIDSANLQLEQSKNEFERSKKLFNDGLISEEAFQNTKTRYEVAQISRDRAQNDFDLAEEKLSKTSIRAPFDCTVLSRPVSIGQAVSGTGGQSSGTEVMEIADLKNLIILSHVNQADVSRMGKNQKVKIEIEAVADLVIDGIVERIAPQATIRSGIKGFSTRIKLQNTNEFIIPGMTATINIPVANSKDVVATKLASIFTERNEVEQRTETYAYVKKDEKYAKQMVEVGVNDLNFVEVLKGLSQGDEVALEKPDDDMIGETITLTGETKAKEEKKTDPLVAKYDTDGDGEMSGEEWRAAMPKMTEDEKAKAMDKMRQRFGGGGRKSGGGRGPGSGRRPGGGSRN
jgi:HlyD family secretion protein